MAFAWQLIRTGRLPNATTLAQKLEVSTKTVSLDLVFMRERLGFEFEYDSARRGYTPTAECRGCAFCGGEK